MPNTKIEKKPEGNNSTPSTEDASRQRSARYPRHNLEKAEALARATFDIGARNCDIEKVAQQAGYKNAENGAFAALRASATIFGLIKSTAGYVSVSEQWIQAFNSEDIEQIKRARKLAIQQPGFYRQLLDDYSDRQLPSLERLTRDLHLNQKYGILKDAASLAAQVFVDSANFAGVIDNKGFLRAVEDNQNISPIARVDQEAFSLPQDSPKSSATPHSSSGVADFSPHVEEELDRIEIRLLNGSKAYLFVPVPLPFGEKERIKKYIDLLLEEPPPAQRTSSSQDISNS